MDLALVLVVILVVSNFMFSAAETALSSLGKLELQSIISMGGWRAKVIHLWIRDPNRILTSVLIGSNISNAAASAVLTLWLSSRYEEIGISVALGIFTVFSIIFSEIVPKALARQTAVTMAPLAMRFLLVVGLPLIPVVFVSYKLSGVILHLFGRKLIGPRQVISEDDVTATIEIATKEGGLDRETGEVLSNLIDFPDRLAKDIMTPRLKVQALSIAWSLEETMRFISLDGHSRYPVVRSSLDELVGVLLVKDLLAHIQKGAQGSWTRVVRRPYFVSEIAALGTILRDMKRWGTHLALVRNETGVLTGLLTLEDIIEEIVGEIRDEHDDPVDAGGDRAMGGPALVNGEIPILDFNERYNASLPMDVAYSTLNGYLLTRTGGEIPPIGTMLFADDVTFRVHSVSESGIATVQIIERTGLNSPDVS